MIKQNYSELQGGLVLARRSSGENINIIIPEPVGPVIRFVRDQRVILDSDLARIYAVTTKRLNEQVKRNRERFPEDFMFLLTADEVNSLRVSNQSVRARQSGFATSSKGNLRSQIATSRSHGGRRYLPYAFTEHGAVMAANLLNSERAVAMSVYVVRAFVKFREVLAGNVDLAKTLDALERKLTARQDVHEKAILQLFSQIRTLFNPPPPHTQTKRKEIGFRPKALKK